MSFGFINFGFDNFGAKRFGGSNFGADSGDFITSIGVENGSGALIPYPISSTFDAGRYNYEGDVFGVDEPVISPTGILNYGSYANLILQSNTFGNIKWTLNGTATRANQGDGSYLVTMPSNNDGIFQSVATLLLGDTITKNIDLKTTSGTGTITITDTFSPSNPVSQVNVTNEWQRFAVSGELVTNGSGLYVRRQVGDTLTEVLVRDAQLTKTPVAMPYVETTTTAATVPLNYSDATHGNKVAIEGDLLDILDGIGVADAQGSAEIEWTPDFSWDDVAGTANSILTLNDTTFSILYFNNTGSIQMYDGVTLRVVNILFQKGTTYLLKPQWGTHPTEGINNMQLIVEDKSGLTGPWQSTIVSFVGSWPHSGLLSQTWTEELPQNIKNIKFYQEPQEW